MENKDEFKKALRETRDRVNERPKPNLPEYKEFMRKEADRRRAGNFNKPKLPLWKRLRNRFRR